MRRLINAPNLALATLWADMLTHAGLAANVQRAFASSIVGELPEVWIVDDSQHGAALKLLAELRHAPHRHWACPGCHEVIDGPFDQCWNCGTAMPS